MIARYDKNIICKRQIGTFNFFKDCYILILNATILHYSLLSVYFPAKTDEFPVIFYIGGLNGYVWVEWYSTYLRMLASHGFFVIGVDYIFPLMSKTYNAQLNQDISKFFKEIDFVCMLFKVQIRNDLLYSLNVDSILSLKTKQKLIRKFKKFKIVSNAKYYITLTVDCGRKPPTQTIKQTNKQTEMIKK